MHAGDPYDSVDTDAAEPQRASPPELERQAGPDRPARPLMRPRWAALAWIAGGIALFVLFLRISLTATTSSDVANNALQAWDMLHGNPLLHGWITGDATYYTFELPVFAFTETIFGLHTIAAHISLALIYLIVAGCAVAIAVTNSGGMARAARSGVVVAVLAAPLIIPSDRWIPIGLPDHTGTTVFLLVCCLLVDRAPDRRFTAPLLCVILCAGQLGDVTVRYVAVPAIVIVCAYRAVAARKILTGDALNLLAAAVSLPLALVVHAVMRHFGSYLTVTPKSTTAPVSQWPHNIALTWHSLRLLFGEEAAPGSHAGIAAVFGIACMLAAAAGIARVLWRWRTARRAEQVLLVAIAANIAVYVISTLPAPNSPHDMAAVLPCSAILAARALVPARISGRLAAFAVTGVAMLAALLPLSVAAAQPSANPGWGQLTAWLHAHGLRYGLAGYWDGSAITVLSGNEVRVRTIKVIGLQATLKPWETDTLWFKPSLHYANFVIINLSNQDPGPGTEMIFGKPASTDRVGNWEILIYRKNLLRVLQPPTPRPLS